MRYKYSLCTLGGFQIDTIVNKKMVGVSLRAVVLERLQDTIKVQFECDAEQQNKDTAWKFPYVAPGGGSWYVMPEEGDTIFVYFPDEKEDSAVGMNSIRATSTGAEKISDPKIKYLRTSDGKEIKLAPKELVLSCCNGKQGQIYIQMEDSGGITIQSSKPVYINSDADINFSADGTIMIAATKDILLRCQSSMIKMDSNITIVSSSVKVN